VTPRLPKGPTTTPRSRPARGASPVVSSPALALARSFVDRSVPISQRSLTVPPEAVAAAVLAKKRELTVEEDDKLHEAWMFTASTLRDSHSNLPATLRSEHHDLLLSRIAALEREVELAVKGLCLATRKIPAALLNEPSQDREPGYFYVRWSMKDAILKVEDSLPQSIGEFRAIVEALAPRPASKPKDPLRHAAVDAVRVVAALVGVSKATARRIVLLLVPAYTEGALKQAESQIKRRGT